MRAVPWLCIDGVEVANEARTLEYVESGLVANGPSANADCACESISDGPYVTPATDEAPWYVAARPDSGEYLGVWAHTVRILNVLQRSSRQRARGGAQLGKVIPTQRIVQVEGLMFASTARGMAYGERWLSDVLADTCSNGCPSAELDLLPACPDGLEGAVSVLSRAEAYWLASNWSGSGTMADLSGNGHTATSSGTVTKLDYSSTQYLWFPGDGGSVRADDAPYVSLVGDHGIRAVITPVTWTPSADQTIFAKWGAAGQRSIRLLLLTTGALRLEWTTDGTTVLGQTSSATGFAANTRKAVRVDFDVNDGSGNRVITFRTKDVNEADTIRDDVQDNTGWGILSTHTTAGTTTVFNSTAPLEVGASTSGTTNPFAGRVYLVRVASETTFSKTNVVADMDATNADNVDGLTWGDGINQWEVVSPAAPSRPIVLVDRDYILLGASGRFEVADSPDLDFTSGDMGFTVAVAYKHGPLPATDTTLLAKKTNDSTAAGYLLIQRDSAATRGGRFTVADGTNRNHDQTNTIEEGALTTLIGLRRASTNEVEAFKDNVGSATATPDDTSNLSNAEVLRIGRLSGGGAGDNPAAWVFSGAALFREELSPAELYVLAQELKGEAPRGQQYVRTLRQVGVIDGPEYEPWGNAAECQVQNVSFQLAAGVPDLLAPPIPLLDDVDIAAGSSRFIVLSTQQWVGDAAGIITLEALDGDVTSVTVTARITLDGTCTTSSGGHPCVQYTIASLEQFHRLTIDAVEKRVYDLDPTMKQNVSGMSLIDFEGRFPYLEVGPCQSICLQIANGGAVTVRATVTQINREW